VTQCDDCGMDDRGFIAGGGSEGILSFYHRVQTSSGTHPSSYPLGTGGSYRGNKAAGT
jgi:hypothetical protein